MNTDEIIQAKARIREYSCGLSDNQRLDGALFFIDFAMKSGSELTEEIIGIYDNYKAALREPVNPQTRKDLGKDI